jgi:hypothetical protein
VLIFSLVKEKM